MTTRKTTLLMILALALVAVGVTPALADETARVARVDAGIDSIAFQPETAHGGMTITVTGPYDFVERHEVGAAVIW